MSSRMPIYPKPSQNVSSKPLTPPLSNIQTKLPPQPYPSSLLDWWYRISAPDSTSANASLEKREVIRRGRVASLILPVIIVLLLLPVPTALGNPILLSTLALVFVVDIFALFVLNRTGHVTAAGVLVVIGIEAGLGTTILTFPGGLGPSNVQLFDLMVQALLVAVAMLAPPIVFLIAAVNSIFIIIVLYSNIPNPELAHIVVTNVGSILPPPITLQVAIAWFTFVLLRSTNKAIKRADRAEELATLIQQNIELQQRELERTHQVEQGIEQMLAALARFSNGDTLARIPDSQENVLWKIGRSLNNLLARLRDYQQKTFELDKARKEIDAIRNRSQSGISSQNELQNTREAATRLKEAIRVARNKRAPLLLPSLNGTAIDEIIMELRALQNQSDQSK